MGYNRVLPSGLFCTWFWLRFAPMERLCLTRHPEGDWQRDEGSISLQQEHPEMVYELNFQHRLKVKYMYSMGYWDIWD